ncbi:MAG: MFS transporter [Firmicutes bacterium]|nr:MFS transporter [Bacillota bacterium]
MDYQLKESLTKKENNKIKTNIALFLSGKLVSLLGTSIYSFAIGLYVLKLTGSGASFSLTIVFSMLPRVILGPFAGSIADNTNRKVMVVGMDLLSGLLMFLLYFITITSNLTLNFIYISAFMLTVFNTFFSVAFDASIPNIVDDKRLMKANSLNQSVMSLTNILGPLIGGLVFAIFDIKYFILFNGISFLLSGITEAFINFNINNKASDNDKNNKSRKKDIFKATLEGFKYLKTQKLLFSLACYFAFVNLFFSGVEVALPYILVNELKLGSKIYGTINGFFAAGSLVFSIVLSTLPEIKNKYRIISLGMFITGILTILVGLPTTNLLPEMNSIFYLIYFMIITFGIGSIVVMINIPINVTLQRETPDEYRGRLFGALTTMSMAIQPLGMVISGLLIDILPSYVIPIVSGILFIMLLLIMGRNKELRNI